MDRPTAEIDVYRAANWMLARYGNGAVPEARRHVERLRTEGDTPGADLWLRIIIAIEALNHPAGRC
jgi:hypothetical protein